MPSGVPPNGSARLAEVMGALSLATDLGLAAPFESGLQVCVLATRLADAAGLSEEDRTRVFYLSLLRHIGCTAGSHEFAAVVGDELVMRENIATIDMSRPAEMFPYMLRVIARVNPPMARPGALLRALGGLRHLKEGSIAVCEVARMLADRLGFDPALQDDLEIIYERWDGRGFPGRARGEGLTPAVRVVQTAETAAIFSHVEGRDAAVQSVRKRSGVMLAPDVAELFVREAGELLDGFPSASAWEDVLALEPGAARTLEGEELDGALRVAGEFADLKSPFTIGHSTGVAELAGRAAEHAGLPKEDVVAVRRAGFVHDIGRVAVSSSVWTKEGTLSRDDWERVRLHPYHTERVLARPGLLQRLGTIASLHHERLDGSGYHRNASGPTLGTRARMLAAADAFHAMLEPRPQRPALAPEEATAKLREEVRAGRLDADAADAVLRAAGRPVGRRRELPGGLTARELEVLRLIARGHTTRGVARELVISPKTADAHLQHIYAKLGVSTRAAATLWAMQRDLVGPLQPE